jgi:hypothetical protein
MIRKKERKKEKECVSLISSNGYKTILFLALNNERLSLGLLKRKPFFFKKGNKKFFKKSFFNGI